MQRSTSDCMHNEQYLPQCVGFVDGTLIPLMEQPLRADCTDFFGRKEGYSLSSLIVCDEPSDFGMLCLAGMSLNA
jgi:hypothetical protein